MLRVRRVLRGPARLGDQKSFEVRPEWGAAWLFKPRVLDVAEEAGPDEGVGLLYVS